jgi:hypothetical protein
MSYGFSPYDNTIIYTHTHTHTHTHEHTKLLRGCVGVDAVTILKFQNVAPWKLNILSQIWRYNIKSIHTFDNLVLHLDMPRDRASYFKHEYSIPRLKRSLAQHTWPYLHAKWNLTLLWKKVLRRIKLYFC